MPQFALSNESLYLDVLLRLLAALAAGGVVGLERSHHGRPAGFRTHAMVCVSSSLLMLVAVYEAEWAGGGDAARAVIDPTRMAQGIMTGIGFLGAGVIVKEGLSVRGLTTAASIWITAAIGILAGIGFYFAAGLGTVFALGTLTLLRWIEALMPTHFFALLTVRYARSALCAEDELRTMLESKGFAVSGLSYRLADGGRLFEYNLIVRTYDSRLARSLSEALNADARVVEYNLAPTGD